MLEILLRLPSHALFRAFGAQAVLPFNITFNVTSACNCRCRTCNIWERAGEILSLDEYEKIFCSLGRAPVWITFSGGEPFLRDDLPEICGAAGRICRPAIINVPTNGSLARLPSMVERICELCPSSQIIVNMSLDGPGALHDEIRAHKDLFETWRKNYDALRSINRPNLSIGVMTVISVFNVEKFKELCDFVLDELKPDSYITEIAEERVELRTVGKGITPSIEDYGRAVDYLLSRISREKFAGISRITQSFRKEYYQYVKRVLVEKRQLIPCYAGFASCQVFPNGDVWPCCIKAEEYLMGNLKAAQYDFGKVWRSREAALARRRISAKECFCPLANASYTNMLFHLPTLMRVFFRFLFH
jgi:sulfatase maturation enzyme AslB (radical SAM superfamily)